MRKPNRSFVVGCLSGIVLTLVGLIGGGAVTVFLLKDWVVASNAQRLKKPQLVSGQKADYDWQVTGMDGAPLNLADTRGKTVFLNFWHPDCLPCLSEIPAINALYEAMSPEGVVFVCVVTEDEGNLAEVIQKEGIRFPVYRLAGKRPERYTTTITPVTFIIDPLGNVVFQHEGTARWDDVSVPAFLRMQKAKNPPSAL